MTAFSLLRAKQVPAGRERPQKEKSWRYRKQTPGSTYLSLHSYPGIPRDWICFQTTDQSGKPLVLYLCGLKLPGFPKSCLNTLGGPGSLEGLPCFAVTKSLCLCHQSALQLGFSPEPGTWAPQSSKGNRAPLSAHLPSVILLSKCQTLGSWG